MAKQDAFLDRVVERLADVEGIRSRAMFGGFGLYSGATFFGLVARGRLYFRTTPATRLRYTARGMGPFRPAPHQTMWNYYEVPAEVLDGEELVAWAREAVAAAQGGE
jgi:DNA transformation protein